MQSQSIRNLEQREIPNGSVAPIVSENVFRRGSYARNTTVFELTVANIAEILFEVGGAVEIIQHLLGGQPYVARPAVLFAVRAVCRDSHEIRFGRGETHILQFIEARKGTGKFARTLKRIPNGYRRRVFRLCLGKPLYICVAKTVIRKQRLEFVFAARQRQLVDLKVFSHCFIGDIARVEFVVYAPAFQLVSVRRRHRFAASAVRFETQIAGNVSAEIEKKSFFDRRDGQRLQFFALANFVHRVFYELAERRSAFFRAKRIRRG